MRAGGRIVVATLALALMSACGSVGGGQATVVSTARLGAAATGGDTAGGDDTPDPTSADPGNLADAGEVHAVRVTGADLAPLDDRIAGTPDDLGLGTVPPALDGQSFDGSPVAIHPGDNDRYKLVFFFAHWCLHCRAEVPRLVTWLTAGSKPANLDVFAVSTAVNRSPINYPPSRWLAREGLTVPVVTDDKGSTAAQAWGLPGYPYAVLLRPDGTVAARIAGEFHDVEAFDAWVKLAMAIQLR